MMKEDKLLLEIKKTKKLLDNFGLCAFMYDPGVKSFVVGHGSWDVEFDGPTWKFVEPLLKELIKYRNKYGTDKSKRKKST